MSGRRTQSRPAAAEALWQLGAGAAARRIAEGALTSEALVGACLERIAALEPEVAAFAQLDPELALRQARQADRQRASGRGIGPLHGVPVAVKDVIDVAGLPCEYGTPAFSGRNPGRDAACVSALRDAGAVILGKTVTTELAVFTPGKTRNPRDPRRSPGGSSSGSAAAVAAEMVPLALGTQTAGSVIRPAAYCGVWGSKPSFGLVSRHGVLSQSPPLDTVGSFARSLEDLALVTEVMAASDARDPDSWPRSRPPLTRIAAEPPPLRPQLCFVESPAWPQAEAVTRAAFGELRAALGDALDSVELPAIFAQALDWQRLIQLADIAKSYGPIVERAGETISPALRELVAEGRAVTAVDYNRARDMVEPLNAGLAQIFQRYDAIVTPATTGVAPLGLESTGAPAFCALWTYLGVPSVSLPLLEAEGLPLGVQLVGPRRDDARLLRTAGWLARRLAAEGADGPETVEPGGAHPDGAHPDGAHPDGAHPDGAGPVAAPGAGR